MKKLVFALLPFLIACHSETHRKLVESFRSNSDTTVSSSTVPAEDETATKPNLQAVKWNGIKEMTDETFKSQILASSAVTLVDFNATWCGPCKQQKPILDKLVKEYEGKINFASVDVDQCPETAKYYSISSIPTLAFYKDAKQGNSTVGLTPYEDLKAMIDKQLNKTNQQ